MKLVLATLLVLAGLQAQAFTTEPVTVVRVLQTGNLMPTIGPQLNWVSTEIEINVASGGCTNPEDFEIRVKQTEKKQILTIVRTKQDFCEAYLPNGENITLRTKSLQAKKPIVVTNPLLVRENFVY